MVGTESDYTTMLSDLASLDHDAIAAYDAAIARVEDSGIKEALRGFRDDHERHARELAGLITRLGGTPPEGAGAKSLLTQGKVVLGGLLGDKAILLAMKTNEDDTNTAYERALNHDARPAATEDVLRRGLADERRHRAWIESTLARL